MSRRRKGGCCALGTGCLILLVICAIIGWVGERYGEIAGWGVAIFLGIGIIVAVTGSALLPKLTNGELWVKDASRLVQEASLC